MFVNNFILSFFFFLLFHYRQCQIYITKTFISQVITWKTKIHKRIILEITFLLQNYPTMLAYLFQPK
jgi:hypothetical protein